MDGGFLAQMRDRIAFILAVAVTTAWLAFVAAYLAQNGWMEVLAWPPVEMGALLAATGGPLAGLWLIVAVLEQRRETAQLTRRLTEMLAQGRQSVQQAEAHTRVLMQMQAHAARAQSTEARTLAFHDLAANAAVLAERLGVMGREGLINAWARYGAGDVTVFVQSFLVFAASHPDIAERMAEAVARDALARTALATFVRRYEQVATALADDKMTCAILEEGALGRGYRLFKEADERAAAPPVAVERGSDLSGDVFAGEDSADARLAELAQRLEAVAPGASAPAQW